MVENELAANSLANAQSKQNPMTKKRSIVEQTHDLRVLINKIFAMRGGYHIKNLP
jgi:hypothetical protein